MTALTGQAAPTIHRALLGTQGRVVRGEQITEVEAVAERTAGRDVVVCGPDVRDNRRLAKKIEEQVGPSRREDPHTRLGPYALPHFQPDPRPPEGHTFYETPRLRATKNP
jgi:hypothetical protein